MPVISGIGPAAGASQIVGSSSLPANPTFRQVYITPSGMFVCLAAGSWTLLEAGGIGNVTGTGTNNVLTKWTNGAGSAIGDSLLADNGTTLSYSGTGGVSAPKITDAGLTAGRVTYAGTGGLLSDDSGFAYNSATHALTTTTFIGALTGNASTASNLSGTPALPNGTTATTQSQADNSTKLATTAYVDTLGATKQATITFGTGVQTALGVNIGSAGAPVLFNGALGTPSSGTLTSATGLPISTGLTGAGTGVLTALGVNVGSAGAFVVNGGALGTPSSGVGTNITGVPLTTGITGTLGAANGGTGVANNAASTLTISGNFGTTLTVTGTTGVTLPTTGTLATLAGAEELTNKTLNASVGKGTWTASGTWTLPALTLGGTVSGGGQQLNNIIIGTTTPLAGAFTTLTASTSLTLAGGTALTTYVEGSWTPVLNFGGATTGITYGVQLGKYTQIGNQVFIQVNIVLTSKGSATGNATITGLPVAATSTANRVQNTAITISSASYTGVSHVAISPSLTTTLLLQVNNGGTDANLTDTAFTNTSNVTINFSYFTN